MRWLRVFVLVIVASGISSLCAAPSEAALDNVVQTIRARQALLRDPTLGPLNLGVKVQDRVAILWGPVPSLELALRAESRLRGLIELVDVRNQLVVMPDDPRDPFVPVRIAPPPPSPDRTPLPLPTGPRLFLE